MPQTFRVAMLVPWVNELPPWLAYFITTAQRSSFLVDWLIFHEMLTPPDHLPENVRFIDLGAGGLSQLFGLKMGEELGMPVRNASLLTRLCVSCWRSGRVWWRSTSPHLAQYLSSISLIIPTGATATWIWSSGIYPFFWSTKSS